MKNDTTFISLLCLIIICLVVMIKILRKKEGFEHTIKNSWSLSNQLTYFKNKYNQNKKSTETKIQQTFIDPVNKKINYYINKYF